ncbi:MAG: hypothetical protein QN178_08050 [Armatimonadota bacterium]|nr:hypothetical protein [Armatimonadota bacterium]
MRRRWVWISAAVALTVLFGGGYYYYTRGQSTAQPQRARDPGMALLLAIRTLERNPDTRLTREQIAAVLPFIKALKDVPASDAEAAAVIAKAVRDTFTPRQRAALEEARRRFMERQGARAASGGRQTGEGAPGAAAPAAPGGLGSAGPGGEGAAAFSDEQRAQMRTRTFERMIRYLERRMR